MCRFTLYLGPPIRLASLIVEPAHSLIRQSIHSDEREEPLNGDGFGVGWYVPRLSPEPAQFHAITPAWNNRNLHSISRLVTSPCVLAHVRAATEGSDVNLANCHPFAHGRYMLMHNGHLGAFRRIRRRLVESLGDVAFDAVRGSTDTEHLFGVFVDEIERRGRLGGPAPAPPAYPSSAPLSVPAFGAPDGGAAALELGRALSAALERVLALTRAEGGDPSYLNVAVSDGWRSAVTRFTDDPNELPESLYMLEGELYEPAARQFADRRADDEGVSVVVSSERLTDDERWAVVPPNSLVVLDRWSAPRTYALGIDGSLLEDASEPAA